MNTITQDERYSLIEDKTPQGLDIGELIKAYKILAIALVVFVPKIYLSSNIYYVSREITKNQNQVILLEEENKVLKKELEDMKFDLLMDTK